MESIFTIKYNFLNLLLIKLGPLTPLLRKKAETSTINKVYPATSVIQSNKSYDVISKTDGILNDIFFNESSFVKEGDKLFSVLSTTSIGEIILSAPFDGYVGITDFKIGEMASRMVIFSLLLI